MTTKTDITLLRCPFCGGPAHFSRNDELVNVRCEGWNPGECLGAGPNCYTEVEAAAGWNRRAAVEADREHIADVRKMVPSDKIRGMADTAYSQYIQQMRAPECLGWEQKVKTGKFGEAELKAHTKAGEFLGRHRAFSECVEILSRYGSSQPAANPEQVKWEDAQRIADLPEIDKLLAGFAEDPTGDAGTMIVLAVMQAVGQPATSAEPSTNILKGLDAWLDETAAPVAQEPVAWIRTTDITEFTDTEPETDGWTALYAAPVAAQAQPVSVTDELPGAQDAALADTQRQIIEAAEQRGYARAVAERARDREDAETQAARDVLAERQRQITAEGWAREHDDEHTNCAMSRAAACYALDAAGYSIHRNLFWPWDWKFWKPAEPRRNLVKAGALVLAEIERIDRSAARAAKEQP